MKRIIFQLIMMVVPMVVVAQDIVNIPGTEIVTIVSDTGRVIRIGKKQIAITEKGNEQQVDIFLSGKDEKHHSGKDFKGHLFGVDLGFNNYMNSDFSTALPDNYRFLNMNASRSMGVTVHVAQESFRLNRKGNIGVVTGVGFEYHNYRLDNNNRLIKNAEGNISFEPIAEDVDKNKLTTLYLTIPLLFEFQGFSKYGDDPAYFSAGLVGGLRLSSHTKIVYGDGDKVKDWGSFNLNDLRYGVMVRAGYKSINLFGVYYPTPLFKKTGDPELHPFCVGFAFLPTWM